MTKLSMCVDLDFCCGCYACQNACKVVNGLEDGVKWLRVMPDYCQPEEVRGELYMDRFPVPVTLKACADCPDRAKGDRPLCAKVCMGRALIVDDFEVVQKWAEGRRTVTYTL